MGLHFNSYNSWVAWLLITLCVPSAQLTGVWESLEDHQLMGGLVKLAVWMEYP
jgi:hypothetical protein